VQEKGSLSFIEETRQDFMGYHLIFDRHVLIIYDDWDWKEGGFRFAYTQNLDVPLRGWEPFIESTVRSTYKGIAKPDQ
jgi:hypothetical protein